MLAEAQRSDRTEAERANFLCITESSLHEFLSVRCPKPDKATWARVDALFAKLDALACELAPVDEERLYTRRRPDPDAPDRWITLPPGEIVPEDERATAWQYIRDEHQACGEADDARAAVQQALEERGEAPLVLLECGRTTPESRVQEALEAAHARHAHVRRWPGDESIGAMLKGLCAGAKTPDAPMVPGDLFGEVGRGDRLYIHPYDSFAAVEALLEQAAADKRVTEICMTLYRTEKDSRIIKALKAAAKRGSRVRVILDVRARGNERANLALADELTDAGVSVTCPGGPRVHGKVLLIARTEDGKVCRAAHFGTGNYNADNARHYTDVSLMTADEELCADAQRFFVAAEAGGEPECETLAVSPVNLRGALLRLIRREMSHAKARRPSGIRAKMNALTDPALIEALYEASRAGVPVELIVRGACCLQPGVPKLSENIRVRSLIGLELEHARVCRFVNGGSPETYISSADWMPRSMDRRHELLIPVRDPDACRRLDDWMDMQLRDTANAWELHVDEYTARRCCAGDGKFDAQSAMRPKDAGTK